MHQEVRKIENGKEASRDSEEARSNVRLTEAPLRGNGETMETQDLKRRGFCRINGKYESTESETQHIPIG